MSRSLDIQAIVSLSCVCLCNQFIWMSVVAFRGVMARKCILGLRSWKCLKTKSKFESKHADKYLKGCKPIQIGLIGVFTVERLNLPKYVYGFTESIFRALLTVMKNEG